MAAISLSSTFLTRTHFSPIIQSPHFPPFSFSSNHLARTTRLRLRLSNSNPNPRWPLHAHVSGPASDYSVSDPDPKLEGFRREKIESKDAISWGMLWSLLAEHKWRLALCVSALVGGTACTLSMPLFSGKFFEVLSGARAEPLWKIMSRIAVVYALEPIFTVIFVVNMNKIWEKVMSVLRAHIFRRMLIQKVDFFDRHKVGELTGLLTSDLGSVKDIVSENVSRDRGFRALSEIVGTICILFTLSPQLAPILGLLMLIVSILVAVYKRSTMPIFKSHGVAQSSMSDCVTETISAIRTVRSFGGEKRQMASFGNQILAYQASGIKLGTYKSINESVTRVAVYVSLLALYCLGGSKVKAGELSIGTVVSFIGYTFTLTFAVQGLVYSFGDLRGAFAAVERINSIFSGSEVDEALAYGLERQIQPKDVQDEKFQLFVVNGFEEKQQPDHVRYMSAMGSSSDLLKIVRSGDISLEDVHFSYPLRPDVEILQGLNLTLKRETITALVGSSGAGKSTVVQLLARFYEPTSGRITVSGEDVRTFDKSEWARVVSIVNQDPVLFSMSLAENIAYGLPDANVSKDDILKAAKAANAHEFIISLPQGYDTLVGERGGLLSGGQRQRVAIARALLKNAPILILDEEFGQQKRSEKMMNGGVSSSLIQQSSCPSFHSLVQNRTISSNSQYSSLLIANYPHNQLPNCPHLSLSSRSHSLKPIHCTNSPGSGENDSKTVLDAFFLGKALGEALTERIESTIGEILSTVGRLQAEQQKQVQEFQEDVLERAKKAKDKAALEALEEQGRLIPNSSVRNVAETNAASSSNIGSRIGSMNSASPTGVVNPDGPAPGVDKDSSDPDSLSSITIDE